MQIDELKPEYKQIIREVVVELFKEIVEENFDDKQTLMLNEWLQDIMSKKIDKYNVNVYGVSLQEGY
tara:strand:- start:458 stop:658 length:201 start_codon:yes stop_codon:yes gene_type:complete